MRCSIVRRRGDICVATATRSPVESERGMILGIDTASVAGNKNIDWTRSKASGLSLAIIRSNYGDQEDTAFKREWGRIRDAAIVRGGYLFLRFPCAGKKAPEPED